MLSASDLSMKNSQFMTLHAGERPLLDDTVSLASAGVKSGSLIEVLSEITEIVDPCGVLGEGLQRNCT